MSSKISEIRTPVKWMTLDGKFHTGVVRQVSISLRYVILEDGTNEIVIVPVGSCSKYEPKLEVKKR